MKKITPLSDTYKKLGIAFTFPIEIKDENGNKPTTSTVMAFGGAVNTTRNGNETYYENSDGSWYMGEYDKKGNKTYSENSRGYWYRCEYNENGTKPTTKTVVATREELNVAPVMVRSSK
jgi:hypothetical protein